ncbi:MAG TPA: DNA circularization N-terminal domain-containing protein, partial [Caulobacteraceae bacterium]|nr:DNA circularization N-terminal domain-containing protein [Caulobacteraceae bacterium]
SDSRVYGGGDVIAQRDAMVAAAEKNGQGALVHPVKGEIQVAVLDLAVSEQWDEGGVIRLFFTLVEAGQRLFPDSTTSTGDAVEISAISADAAALSDFQAVAQPIFDAGGAAIQNVVSTLGSWGSQITTIVGQATRLGSLASQLTAGPLATFGRFFAGGNAGFLSATPMASVYSAATTVDDLISAGAGERALIGTDISALTAAAEGIGLSTTAADIPVAAQTLFADVLAAHADPGGAIGALESLIGFAPGSTASLTPIGAAACDLMRRSAATALARAAAVYQPSSYDDAAGVRTTITGLYDAEILIAGDEGEDATYGALRALRAAVIQDLTVRGASLARIQTFAFGAPLPALHLATRLYRDPSRADELVIQAIPVHPLFMPPAFQALAS